MNPRVRLGSTGTLPRDARIRRRGDFSRLQKNGVRIHTRAFTIVVDRSPEGLGPRFGCAVSRRVGGAVVRNRVRRILKEIFRRCANSLPPVDFMFIAKPDAALIGKAGFDAMSAELMPGVERALRALERKPMKDEKGGGG